jgi:hypothetical protein
MRDVLWGSSAPMRRGQSSISGARPQAGYAVPYYEISCARRKIPRTDKERAALEELALMLDELAVRAQRSRAKCHCEIGSGMASSRCAVVQGHLRSGAGPTRACWMFAVLFGCGKLRRCCRALAGTELICY